MPKSDSAAREQSSGSPAHLLNRGSGSGGGPFLAGRGVASHGPERLRGEEVRGRSCVASGDQLLPGPAGVGAPGFVVVPVETLFAQSPVIILIRYNCKASKLKEHINKYNSVSF